MKFFYAIYNVVTYVLYNTIERFTFIQFARASYPISLAPAAALPFQLCAGPAHYNGAALHLYSYISRASRILLGLLGIIGVTTPRRSRCGRRRGCGKTVNGVPPRSGSR